jgi:heme-degrading monooxygenase HmoA
MLVIVWEYEAKEDRVDDFESFYGPDGPWSTLFRSAPGFVSVTLMKDLNNPRRFLVADRWITVARYEDFKQSRADRYAELSARGAKLFTRETEVGRFDFVE